MASNDVRVLPAVLAIDFGSKEVTARIAWRNGDETETEIVMYRDQLCYTACPVNRAPSAILPFDNDPIKYVHGGIKHEREKFPVNFGPFVLLDKLLCLDPLNPVRVRLRQEKSKAGFDEAQFKAGVKDGSKQLLRFILTSAKHTLGMPHVRIPDNCQVQINTVAMAVPSQCTINFWGVNFWGSDFRVVYERLLKEAFAEVYDQMSSVAARNINVVFHTDATAIAHYFLQFLSGANRWGLHDRGVIPSIDEVCGSINTQLFIYCDGYHASSVLTTIQRDASGKRILCEIDPFQGAEGGIEWWIDCLVDEAAKIIIKPGLYLDGHTTWTDDERAQLKEAIIFRKRPLMLGRPVVTTGLRCSLGFDMEVSFEFGEEHLHDAFCHSFRYIQRMIRQQLMRVSSIKRGWAAKDHAVTILAAGEATGHAAFMPWMEARCAEQGLPKPIDLRGMGSSFYGGAQVAWGAAYATLAQQASGISDNATPSGKASPSGKIDPAPEGPQAEDSQPAGRKRKASAEPDDAVPAKHTFTMQ